jgi:hypothetical protein
MNRFQWKWIFTGNKTCCTKPFWFAMVAILNQKWPPKWGLNNNKKRCKKNKSPNFVWGLNKKQSKHNMSPETSFGGHNKKWSKHNKI